MCNRYQLRSSIKSIRQAFGVTQELFEPSLPAEYFPGSTVPVIRSAKGGRELVKAEWGIMLGKHRVTNSRDDKIGRTWGRYMSRRVVLPLSRAVEWKYPLDLFGQPRGKPQPWVLYPADEGVAAIAAIADLSGGGHQHDDHPSYRHCGRGSQQEPRRPEDDRLPHRAAGGGTVAEPGRWTG